MDVNGSPEYELIWKEWDMPSGPPICALRASGRRTSGNGFTGWPSPSHREKGGGEYSDPAKAIARLGSGHQKNLQDVAQAAGWNSPRATDGSNGNPNQAGGCLPNDASKAGWATPQAFDAKTNQSPDGVRARIARNPNMSTQITTLSYLAQVSGPPSSGIPAQTASKGGYLLNPYFSAWLMGFPKEWVTIGLRTAFRSAKVSKAEPQSCAESETQSTPTSRQPSSAPTSKNDSMIDLPNHLRELPNGGLVSGDTLRLAADAIENLAVERDELKAELAQVKALLGNANRESIDYRKAFENEYQMHKECREELHTLKAKIQSSPQSSSGPISKLKSKFMKIITR
jgi:hypothetical protein